MLPVGRFHPFELDTFGLGMLLHHICVSGARQCLLGIGGSATNDGGFGLARALGWEFRDKSGSLIERWPDLVKLACISGPRRRTWPKSLVVAVDVQNPLLGPRGATRIYGPQKGLRARELPQAERCLHRLGKVVEQQFGGSLARVPGAGAAGGLGFGLVAFCGARLEAGFDLFAGKARLPHRSRKVDLVLTGEGKIDDSTFMGKGVGRLADLCRARNIPCFGFAGTLGKIAERKDGFAQVFGLTQLTGISKAMAEPAFWLRESAAQAAQNCAAL
jgi:glycerate kinase